MRKAVGTVSRGHGCFMREKVFIPLAKTSKGGREKRFLHLPEKPTCRGSEFCRDFMQSIFAAILIGFYKTFRNLITVIFMCFCGRIKNRRLTDGGSEDRYNF